MPDSIADRSRLLQRKEAGRQRYKVIERWIVALQYSDTKDFDE